MVKLGKGQHLKPLVSQRLQIFLKGIIKGGNSVMNKKRMRFFLHSKMILFFCLPVFMSFFWHGVACAAIQNGNFEETMLVSKSEWIYGAMKEKNMEFDEPLIVPKYWFPNPFPKGEYRLVNDPEKAHSGNICIKIKGDMYYGGSKIEVGAGDQIVLSFWARTSEDVETAKVFGVLYAYGTDEQGKVKHLDDALRFEREVGKEWQRFEGTITIPATSVRTGEIINSVTVAVRSYQTAVYFDDVDVKYIKSNEKVPVNNGNGKDEKEKKSSQPAGLIKESAVIFSKDFTDWQKIDTVPAGWDLADNLFPADWNIEDRPGETGFIRRIVNSERPLESGKYSLFLDGRIISKPIVGLGQKTLRISLLAKGPGGSFNIRLREYGHPDAKEIQFLADVIKEKTGDEWRKYEGTVTMTPWWGSSVARIELIGERVIIGKVEVSIVEPVKLSRHIYTIPLAEQPPQIDGSFLEKEWAAAVGMKNGFMNYQTKSLVERQTEYRVTSDGKKLYIVIRTPLRGGLKRTIKERDGNVWEDESLEIFINPTPKEDKPPAVYQFVINSLGTVFDQVSNLATGTDNREWQCQGLEVATGQQEDLWVLEVGIPLAEVGIKPGSLFGLNLARNLQNPAEYATITGFPYKDYGNMALCKISSDAPAIYWEYRIDTTETTSEDRGSLFGTIKNLTGEGRTYRITSILGNETNIQTLNFLPGQSQAVMFHSKEPLLAQTLFSFEVEDKDGEKLMSQGVIFNAKKDISFDTDKMTLLSKKKKNVIEFYPVQQKITFRLNNLAGRPYVNFGKDYGQSEVIIYKEGKEIFKQTIPKILIVENTGYLTIPFNFQENGFYDVCAFIYNIKGDVVEYIEDSIEKKPTPWLGNQLGKDHIVIPPFTPIVIKNTTVSCWGRDIQFGSGGLPTTIKSQGENILNSPIRLVLNSMGKSESSNTLKGDLKWKEKTDERIMIESNIPFSDMAVKTNILMEYDGMIRYEMELLPTKSVEINSLTLEIPLRDVSYFHWASRARGANHCFMMNLPPEGEYKDPKVPVWKPGHSYQEAVKEGMPQAIYFPPGDGLIWSSVGVTSENIYGNFLPFLWLGNARYGLSWFADNDRGWINNPEHPCFELVREGTTTILKVNFITGPVKITEPRLIVFGLMPTPVKPRITGANLAIKIASFGFGNTFLNESSGFTYRDPYLAKHFREARAATDGAIHNYIANQQIPVADPVVKYMINEWEQEPFGSYSELENLKYKVYGPAPANYILVQTCRVPSLTDYEISVLNENLAQGLIDGVYMDNSYPNVCVNLQHENCGYIRDDGKIQGGYHIFETREFIKRSAVISHLHNTIRPHFSIHTTSAMVIPSFSFGDLCIDGEWDYKGRDFMDFFPLPYLEVFGAGAWGVNQGWLPMLRGEAVREEKPTRTLLAGLKLYDMFIWHTGVNSSLLTKLDDIEKSFGVAEKDCRFVGYWEKSEVITGLPVGVKASYYLRPDKGLLVYISNFLKEKQEVSLQFNLLPFKIGKFRVLDAENKQEVIPAGNKYPLGIEGKDYRLLFVEFAK